MTSANRAGSRRSLLSNGMVMRTFALVMLGRLAYGLLPLCLLFTVRDASGSFTFAAVSLATYGLATLAMPWQARFVDRLGQRRVLPVFACFFVLLLLGLVAAATVHPPRPLLLVLSALLGLAVPSLGPAMRAQWREVAVGPQRIAAYSIDSVAEESVYLVGPLLAGLLLGLNLASFGLVVAAALVAVGVAGLVTSPFQPPTASELSSAEGTSSQSPLRVPRFRAMLVALAAVGGSGAMAFVGLAGLADRAGTPEAAGWAEAAMAAGAVMGGLLWAKVGRPEPWGLVLAVLLAFVAASYLVSAVGAPSLVLVTVALAVGATAFSPIFVVAFTAADGLVPPHRRTEASTWVSTGFNAGNALGTGVAGALVGLGESAAFATAGGGALVAAGIALTIGCLERDRTSRVSVADQLG